MEGVVHLKIASGIYLQIEHGVWAPVWVYCLATCLSSLLVNISECGVAFLMLELVGRSFCFRILQTGGRVLLTEIMGQEI